MLESIQDGPEAIDPAEALLREVGAHLRQTRQERGKEIEDVAEILRIQPGYVAALERGDLSDMPGRTYALGFLRSYAQYLGFDGDDLISQIKSSVGGLAGKAALQGRAPLSESRLPKLPILVVSLAVLAGAYAGWAYVQDDQAVPELVDEVPPELREQTPFETGPRRAPVESGSSGLAPAATGHRLAEESTVRSGSAEPSEPAQNAFLPAGPQPPTPRQASDAPMPGEMAPAIVAAIRSEPGAASTPVRTPALPLETAHELESADTPEDARPMQVVPASAPAPAVVEARAREPAAEPASAAPADDAIRLAAGSTAISAPAEPRASRLAPTTVAAVDSDRDPAAVGASAGGRTVPADQPDEPESRAPADAMAAETPRPPRTYGTRTSGTRVVLRARSKTWVHISSTHNDYLWVQTLRPGDTFVVPDRPDLVLWTGNAGGVEVLVDDALLPPLGPEKSVMRDVSLQPRDLLRQLLPLPQLDPDEAPSDEALAESARAEDSSVDEAEVSDLASTVKPPMIWRSSRSAGSRRAGEISEYGRSE
jgi:cytoskeleton protein RodZ